jgi:exodeoxyribonuclease V alpha subunit
VTVEVVLEGEVARLTYEREDSSFRVIKLTVAGRADAVAVVGIFPHVPVGARVRVRGRMEVDGKHGEQLRADAVTELAPDTLVGIERYLGSGMIHGIGGKYAKRIVAKFGMATLRVLDEEPERLREVEGLGQRRIESIVKGWGEQRAVSDVMVFLQAHGASSALAVRIMKRYGPRAMAIVSREPYRLAIDVWGVGFKTADRIAAAVGIARDSPERMQAGVLQTIHDVTEAGHVYVAEDDLFTRAAGLLALDPEAEATRAELGRATGALALAGHVVPDTAHGASIVYARAMYDAEVRLARCIVELGARKLEPLPGAAAAIEGFERQAGVSLAPEQRRAVEEAARSELLVVTGGPGVGKTTIVRAILAVFRAAKLAVSLAAPTGRASKRMSEATAHEASTLHRLLDFDPKKGAFRRDRGRPLEAGAVVVDEASMIDLQLADALLQALPPGTRLVLVGDVDQLPSVGPGAVLRDVIASGRVPCVRLTQIFRQAAKSRIVTNAHRINSGEEPLAPLPGDADSDFFVVDRREAEAAQATILELVTSRIPRRFGLDPVRDVQVLTPMHRGAAGSMALNQALQAALNPDGRAITRGTRSLRAGDKVMQLKNDYDKSVFNGDVGFVASVHAEATGEEAALVVRFDDRDVPYTLSALDELTLAYASTVHKAQGSEYPAVVLPLLTSHFVMLSRNLLYTAVTRGKRLVVLVADPRALRLALSEVRRGERRALLAARIARAFERREES